VIHVQDIHI